MKATDHICFTCPFCQQIICEFKQQFVLFVCPQVELSCVTCSSILKEAKFQAEFWPESSIAGFEKVCSVIAQFERRRTDKGQFKQNFLWAKLINPDRKKELTIDEILVIYEDACYDTKLVLRQKYFFTDSARNALKKYRQTDIL